MGKKKLQLKFSTLLLFRQGQWGRLASMKSSLATEMPTASGVFSAESQQLYMPNESSLQVLIVRYNTNLRRKQF